MKKGDIVIVPYGNTAFRAIAEVTGDYRFEASAEGFYAHAETFVGCSFWKSLCHSTLL